MLRLAGVEYGGECFCGTYDEALAGFFTRVVATETCERDAPNGGIYEREIGWLCPNTTTGEKCGGNELINIFSILSFMPSVGLCFDDPLDARVLEFPKKVGQPDVIESYWFNGKNGNPSNSKALCKTTCENDGFTVFGEFNVVPYMSQASSTAASASAARPRW